MIQPEELFEFVISSRKSVLISVKTFFFSETTCVWAKNLYKFPISAEKSVLISAKTFFFFGGHLFLGRNFEFGQKKTSQSDSRAMNIWVKVTYSCLNLYKLLSLNLLKKHPSPLQKVVTISPKIFNLKRIKRE